jgi:hypothetical protein
MHELKCLLAIVRYDLASVYSVYRTILKILLTFLVISIVLYAVTHSLPQPLIGRTTVAIEPKTNTTAGNFGFVATCCTQQEIYALQSLSSMGAIAYPDPEAMKQDLAYGVILFGLVDNDETLHVLYTTPHGLGSLVPQSHLTFPGVALQKPLSLERISPPRSNQSKVFPLWLFSLLTNGFFAMAAMVVIHRERDRGRLEQFLCMCPSERVLVTAKTISIFLGGMLVCALILLPSAAMLALGISDDLSTKPSAVISIQQAGINVQNHQMIGFVVLGSLLSTFLTELGLLMLSQWFFVAVMTTCIYLLVRNIFLMTYFATPFFVLIGMLATVIPPEFTAFAWLPYLGSYSGYAGLIEGQSWSAGPPIIGNVLASILLLLLLPPRARGRAAFTSA